MRIVLIAQNVTPVLSALDSSEHDIVGIVESAQKRRYSPLQRVVRKIIHTGYSLLDQDYINLKKHAKLYGIPYYFLRKGDGAHFERWVRNRAPDLIVVYEMSQLLRPEVLKIPESGVINLHPSHLPEYRGPNPIFWQYHDFELQPGVTVHFLDNGEDTGDIIYQERFSLNPGEPPSVFMARFFPHGVKMLLAAIEDIERSNVNRIPQPEITGLKRARNIKPEEYRELVEWDCRSVEQIFHFLKGTPLYHVQLTDRGRLYRLGARIDIKNYERTGENIVGYIPGKTYHEAGSDFIACIDGKIYIDISFSFKELMKNIFYH